jgi:hypothetical protein
MPLRCFPKPWTVEPIPNRVIDGNGVVLAHVYGQLTGDRALRQQAYQ